MIPSLRKDFQDAENLRQKYQSWKHEQTAEIQLAKLKTVWADSVRDIPYYTNLVARNEAPFEIRSWDDFRSIPELNREILQSRHGEFVRLSGAPDFMRMTGGSTGNPVKFGVWHREDRVIRLLKLTLWLRAGYRPEQRLFLIWGHSHLLGTGWLGKVNHFKRKLKDWLLGYRRVDAYRLGPDRYREIAASMLDFRPSGLISYASALDSFLRANRSQFAHFRALNLCFVMPCAEPVPKEDSMNLFREAFGCPVVQEFGGVDFGQVASRYEDEPFWVFPDYNIVEGLPIDQSDRGEAVLVTSLYPRYLPLIRYRQGDVVTGICRESHGHIRTFQSLEGRINDMISLGNGVEIHSVAIFHCIHQESSILNIQMVLENSGPRLRLATLTGHIDAEVEMRVRHRLSQILPALGNIAIECVYDVETTRAGKRRWFVDKRL